RPPARFRPRPSFAPTAHETARGQVSEVDMCPPGRPANPAKTRGENGTTSALPTNEDRNHATRTMDRAVSRAGHLAHGPSHRHHRLRPRDRHRARLREPVLPPPRHSRYDGARLPRAAFMIRMTGIKKVYTSGVLAMEALADLSLHVGKGEFVAIMGPSGS